MQNTWRVRYTITSKVDMSIVHDTLKVLNIGIQKYIYDFYLKAWTNGRKSNYRTIVLYVSCIPTLFLYHKVATYFIVWSIYLKLFTVNLNSKVYYLYLLNYLCLIDAKMYLLRYTLSAIRAAWCNFCNILSKR